jgi:hypothetical protein
MHQPEQGSMLRMPDPSILRARVASIRILTATHPNYLGQVPNYPTKLQLIL